MIQPRGFESAPMGAIEVEALYTDATSNVPVISVLTTPFFLSPNRALLLRIMSLFGERKNGRVNWTLAIGGGCFHV